jgi:hypothetical protein
VENSDERILGSGDFVDRVLADAGEKVKRQLPPREMAGQVQKIIEKASAKGKINQDVLFAGSRRRSISAMRAELARTLVEEGGISMAKRR